MRSLTPRRPARLRRIAVAAASRCIRTPIAASCVATKTSRSSATCATRSLNDRFRMEAQPIVELAHTGGARRFELLLRMIDATGESVAPDKFLTAAERYQLATDIDRWVVQYALEILSSAAPRAGEHGRALRDQHFRPVARRRAVPDLSRAEAARVRPAGRHAVVRDHRNRGGRQHRARRDAHPPAAGSGPRDRAGRFRPRPVVAHVSEVAAGVAPEDRRRPGARPRGQRALARRWSRRSCSWRRR